MADAAGGRARLAFLVMEGAFFLRFLGLMPNDRTTWDSVFSDIEEFLGATSPVAEGA